MNTVYINNNTNNIIDQATIKDKDDNGIFVNSSNCWKYIPNQDITSYDVYGDTYYPQEQCRPPLSYKEKHLSDEENTDGYYTEALSSCVGFQDFMVCTRMPSASSGIVSNTINVENTAYITLEGTQSGDGSVEYSILDGSQEVPILPVGATYVIKEKLFYDLEADQITTRFPIDLIQGIDPVLYEDGHIVQKEYTQLAPEDFRDHTYCLTYTAAGNTQEYIPVASEIRLKIIIRQYGQEPVSIHNLLIHRYGGSVLWMFGLSD